MCFTCSNCVIFNVFHMFQEMTTYDHITFLFFLNIQLEANLMYILLVWTRQLVYATLHCQSLAIYTLLPHAWFGWTLTMQVFHCHWAFTLGFMCSTELWLVILSGAYLILFLCYTNTSSRKYSSPTSTSYLLSPLRYHLIQKRRLTSPAWLLRKWRLKHRS